MIPDLDIFRSAKLMLWQHGEAAAIESAMKADDMLERGDLDGVTVWRRIPDGNQGTAGHAATKRAALH